MFDLLQLFAVLFCTISDIKYNADLSHTSKDPAIRWNECESFSLPTLYSHEAVSVVFSQYSTMHNSGIILTPSVLNTHCETTVYKYFKILASNSVTRGLEKEDARKDRRHHSSPKGAPRRPVGTARPSTLGYRGSDPRSSNPNEACPQCISTGEQLPDHRSACLLFRHCTTD